MERIIKWKGTRYRVLPEELACSCRGCELENQEECPDAEYQDNHRDLCFPGTTDGAGEGDCDAVLKEIDPLYQDLLKVKELSDEEENKLDA